MSSSTSLFPLLILDGAFSFSLNLCFLGRFFFFVPDDFLLRVESLESSRQELFFDDIVFFLGLKGISGAWNERKGVV